MCVARLYGVNFIRSPHRHALHRPYDAISVWWVFGERVYRLEAALARKAAWCGQIIARAPRAVPREIAQIRTRSVLKPHRGSVSNSRFVSPRNAMWTRRTYTRTLASGYFFFFSFFFPFLFSFLFLTMLRYRLRIISFRDSIILSPLRHGNHRVLARPRPFHRSRVLFFPSIPTRADEKEAAVKWMANECVSETCFDSGDNKGPLKDGTDTLLCSSGYTWPRPSPNILRILNGARANARETDYRASGRAFFRQRILLKRASHRAFILFSHPHLCTGVRVTARVTITRHDVSGTIIFQVRQREKAKCGLHKLHKLQFL